jgi:peptidoglycan/xylan/chitin deacetylase (PgdA/CDA1 family)
MRTLRAVALFLCALAVSLQPALGQEACAPDPSKLGVSRTIAIDASPGPQFGGKYKGASLLKDGEVVLTFDDGPLRPTTRPILEALAEHCTKATFFMLGQMALADRALVKEVARRGHTVATHTWSHANLQVLSSEKGEAEIELGLSAVQQALGKPVAPFFRFPYLRDTAASLVYVGGRHLAAFALDIDSRDYQTRDAAAVNARVMKDLAARGKGIILLHDIHASTAKALPRLLAALKEHGYKVVHIKPKAGAETLAEYDALVKQSAERKRLATPGHPLAKRSITWPATSLTLEASGAAKASRSAAGPQAPEPAEDDWTASIWRQVPQ